jgi:hypothetical protein
LLFQFNPLIAFGSDALKRFNIRKDCLQLIDITGNQIALIAFDSNCGYSFEVWDKVQLFLQASFRDAKYNHACEKNESYYKLTK